ncbi:MAG: hypothetical protein AMXMBFR59_28230 [Rhodanobacteraceae bacterium]
MSNDDLNDFLRPINAATFSTQAHGAGYRFVIENGNASPYRPRTFGWLRGDLGGRHVFVRDLHGPKQVRNWTFRWSEGTSAIELEFDAHFEIHAEGIFGARAVATALLAGPGSAGETLHALIANQLNRELVALLQQSEKRGESLHDCFTPAADGLSRRRELDASVSDALSRTLGVPFRIGFQMRDPAPRQIEVRCCNAFTLQDSNAGCEVVTTALLQFDNFQSHKRSGLHDEASIRAAMERQVGEAVKELLFGKRYYAVARAFAGGENAIHIDMERRLQGFAQSIGYRICLFNTLVDIPALKLFRGLNVEVPAGESYQLRSRGFAELSASLHVQCGEDESSDEATARLIGVDVADPAEPIAALVRRCCRETLARFDYSAVSVSFDEEVRPAVEARILADLAHHGLRATITRLRSEPTEDAVRFMELCRLPAIDFVATVPPQADAGNADEVVVEGVIDILDIAPDDQAWLRFQSGNFGYRRDSTRSLDDMRAQGRLRGIADVDSKDRRALAIAIEVAEIRLRVIATLRKELAMQPNLAQAWTTAANAARIERWADRITATAIADEFGLRLRLRGFGRRDTLSADVARAIRETRLRNERDIAVALAQADKAHLLQDATLVHEHRQAQLRRLDRINDDELANSADMNHDVAREQAQREAAAMQEQIQQRRAQLHTPPSAPVAAVWQPPAPVVFDEADSLHLQEAAASAGSTRENAAAEAAAPTARLPSAE